MEFLAPGVTAMAVWEAVQEAGEQAGCEAEVRKEQMFSATQTLRCTLPKVTTRYEACNRLTALSWSLERLVETGHRVEAMHRLWQEVGGRLSPKLVTSVLDLNPTTFH